MFVNQEKDDAAYLGYEAWKNKRGTSEASKGVLNDGAATIATGKFLSSRGKDEKLLDEMCSEILHTYINTLEKDV